MHLLNALGIVALAVGSFMLVAGVFALMAPAIGDHFYWCVAFLLCGGGAGLTFVPRR